MNQTLKLGGLMLVTSMLGMACTNPTIDPASTFYAEGKALAANGDALTGAEVKVIRYFHPAKLLKPDVDDLFDCDQTDCGYAGLDLEIGLVAETTTDMSGNFTMEFKGSDIAGSSGITDDRGRVEGSNLVIVIKDPSDMNGVAGVFTNDHTYQQSDKRWDPGNLKLWNASAVANVGQANTNGMVNFSWDKVENAPSSSVDTTYRLEVRGGGSRLVQRCRDGSSLEAGGCTEDSMSGKLNMDVSAFSIYNFYSNQGDFTAYIRGNGVDMNWRSKFTVEGMFEDPSMNRDVIPATGTWAVSESGAETLDMTEATDGSPSSRLTLTTPATSIYLQLPAGSLVTDAGLLNTVVDNAYSTCVVLEFSGTAYNDVAAAGASNGGDWVQKGRFCGGNGANNEMSALVSFDTSNSMGQSAAWMRFRLENDGMGMASSAFTQIGEVAVYKQR
jgi:hypothetical protein